MAQESTKGWGGKRDGQGRPTSAPLGGGTPKSVAVRIGSDLLEQLAATYPDFPSDSERIRAAIWAAVGKPIS